MEKKGSIGSSIALIKRTPHSTEVNIKNYNIRKKVLDNQAEILNELQKQEDVERKRLLEEILL
jgi:hypothetical protein